MRKSLDIKQAAKKISERTDSGKKEMMMLLLEVLLDIRDKLSKQNEMIRRNGRNS